ncbi:hypothetical protein CASFOL_028539 [Castilleja foliolosa]|uniref:KIB1-4 beta-propeller domain-containing protein n=1 Tax=Castilleja foliolosa TaxID=1961234 RepID=A0ABD3CDQ0_9LAMI
MGLSLLKITGNGTSLRSIFRSLNSYRGVRMVSTVKYRSAEAQVPSFSSDSLFASSSPLLMLSPNRYSSSYEFYSFAKNRLFTIPKSEKSTFRYATKIFGSSHGWLGCFNYRRYELYLSNPLSGRRVNLPPIDYLPIPHANLRHGHGINKIIISCSDPESKECRAMMLFNNTNSLAFCCPGISKWTKFNSVYEDIVYCATHELFFAIRLEFTSKFDGDLVLEEWDLRNPLSPSLVWSGSVDKLDSRSHIFGQPNPAQDDEFGFNHQNYLVVSQQGELFLVYRYVYEFMMPNGSCAAPVNPEDEDDCDIFNNRKYRYPPKTVNYKVFKIVRDGDGWKKVFMDGHLDAQVMFVGWLSHGMAMPAAEANGFQPNTICFTDDTFTYSKEVRGTDNGIFDYKNKTFHPCYYPFDYQSLKKKIMPPPLWLTRY